MVRNTPCGGPCSVCARAREGQAGLGKSVKQGQWSDRCGHAPGGVRPADEHGPRRGAQGLLLRTSSPWIAADWKKITAP
jgi:hypothetical protein